MVPQASDALLSGARSHALRGRRLFAGIHSRYFPGATCRTPNRAACEDPAARRLTTMPRKLFPLDADALLSQGLLTLILAGYIAMVYTAVLSLLLAIGVISYADPRVVFNPP